MIVTYYVKRSLCGLHCLYNIHHRWQMNTIWVREDFDIKFDKTRRVRCSEGIILCYNKMSLYLLFWYACRMTTKCVIRTCREARINIFYKCFKLMKKIIKCGGGLRGDNTQNKCLRWHTRLAFLMLKYVCKYLYMKM